MKTIPLKPLATITSILLLILTTHPCDSRADSPPTNITFNSLDGKTITPLKSKKGKPTVVIFITTDCPIANALAPEINRIYDHYQALNIKFTLAHVDPELSTKDAKQHASDYSLKAPIIIDRKHQLVKLARAKLTPQTAVFNEQGKLVYSGRLNNQWADYGKRRVKATENNLRDTLDALLAGKPAPKDHTPAVGCYIPDLD
ncbi:MAG: redoxin domain-containing protein [Verrucomicrobia bacterium]|nr:redoxin domain-containing protein [Verrucomicrobiota bacterium]